MNDDFVVVYQFHNSKTKCNAHFATVHKKIPESTIEKIGDQWVITLGHYSTEKEANAVISKAVSMGYWGGIYNP